MTPEKRDETLMHYLAARQQQRADHVQEFLDGLTQRERRLVREAAVMGFVLGDRHGAANTTTRFSAEEKFPGDTEIVNSVVAHCQSTADMYPLIADSPYQLVAMLLRQAIGPAPLAALTEAVRQLMPAHAGDVAAIVAEYVADGDLTETPEGLAGYR